MNASDEATDGAASEESRIESALKRLQGKDRIGRVGEVAGVAGGVAAGATAAGSIAGAVGATTLLGSHGLAAAFGGVLVTTTPVGWVIGCAVVGGAAAYGVVKLARSGGHQDALRDRLSKSLTSRLRQFRTSPPAPDEREFQAALDRAIGAEAIGAEDAQQIRTLVLQGKLLPSIASQRLRLLVEAQSNAASPRADC